MSDEINRDNEVNELQPEYGNKWPLKIFHSFEEANNYDDQLRADTPGIQHWRNVTFLILNRYEKELKTPMEKKLIIGSDEDTD